MKRLYSFAMSLLLLLLSSTRVQGQDIQPGLNQVELLKQFIGTWENTSIKDTVYTAEFKPYGNGGLDFSLRSVTRGKVWLEMKQLWGYDKKSDRLVIAGLMKDSPGIMLQRGWFTTKNRLEQIPYEFASAPEKATFIVRFEIKSPDLITREEFVNGKSLGTENYRRVKN